MKITLKEGNHYLANSIFEYDVIVDGVKSNEYVIRYCYTRSKTYAIYKLDGIVRPSGLTGSLVPNFEPAKTQKVAKLQLAMLINKEV